MPLFIHAVISINENWKNYGGEFISLKIYAFRIFKKFLFC